LIEAADDELSGLVGSGNEWILNGIDQLGKDLGQHARISGVEVRDDDARRDTLGLEFEEQEMNGVVVVLGIDLEGEDIIRIDVNGKVGVTPDSATPLAVRTNSRGGADLEPLVVNADDTAGADNTEIPESTRQRSSYSLLVL
jgi:hypothetical protein